MRRCDDYSSSSKDSWDSRLGYSTYSEEDKERSIVTDTFGPTIDKEALDDMLNDTKRVDNKPVTIALKNAIMKVEQVHC